MQEFLISGQPDLQAAREAWLKMLARERRLSALTVDAYERDTRQFLQFLTGHCGGAPGIADIGELAPADLRAFLAAGAPAAPARARSAAGWPASARSCAFSNGAASPTPPVPPRCARRSSRNRCPSR